MARTSYSAEQVGEELRGAVVAQVEGEQVGELRFTVYRGEVCRIEQLYVDPDHRRQGIATQMIATLRLRLPHVRPARFAMNAEARALADAIYDRFAEPEEG